MNGFLLDSRHRSSLCSGLICVWRKLFGRTELLGCLVDERHNERQRVRPALLVAFHVPQRIVDVLEGCSRVQLAVLITVMVVVFCCCALLMLINIKKRKSAKYESATMNTTVTTAQVGIRIELPSAPSESGHGALPPPLRA